jgi:hypothetical protein
MESYRISGLARVKPQSITASMFVNVKHHNTNDHYSPTRNSTRYPNPRVGITKN